MSAHNRKVLVAVVIRNWPNNMPLLENKDFSYAMLPKHNRGKASRRDQIISVMYHDTGEIYTIERDLVIDQHNFAVSRKLYERP